MIKRKALIALFGTALFMAVGFGFFAPTADASIAFVQTTSSALSAGAPTTATTCHVKVTATAGNLGVLMLYFAATGPTVTITSTAGTNWTLAASTTGGSNYSGIYYSANLAGGTLNVTSTFNASHSALCIYAEYSGVATTSPLDVTTSSRITGTALTTGTSTTSGASDLVLGTGGWQATEGITAGSGLNLRATSTRTFFEDSLNVSAGAHSVNVTLAGSQTQSTAVLAAFKAPSAGGGSPVIRMLMRIINFDW